MPFAREFDDVYKFGIKAIGDELGIIAERVDEQIFSETMWTAPMRWSDFSLNV
jgi:hypothetical protein